MPKDGRIALFSLIGLGVWLFVILPLMYWPVDVHAPTEILGVKPGEWLLALATLGLWYATWRLVKGADKTAERQLRAYVHIRSSTVSNLLTGNGAVTFTIVLENSGKTPAYRVSFFAANELAKSVPGGPPLQPATVASAVENITLGPGAGYTASISRAAFSQAEIAAMMSTDSLLLHGKINYEDVFKKPRSTKFCLAKGGAPQYPVAGSDLFVTSYGNEAD